jgi:hypothetical protein
MNIQSSKWRLLLGAAIIGFAIMGFLEWRDQHKSDADQEQSSASSQSVSVVNGQTVLTLTLARQKAAGIANIPVHDQAFNRQNRAYGTVIDPKSLSDLHNNYSNAADQLRLDRAKLHQSQLMYARMERLYAIRAESAADRDATEAAYRVDQATVAAAQTQLETLASTARQDWGGTLAQAIIEGTAAFRRLADQQDVLMQATFPPDTTFTEPPSKAVASWGSRQRVRLRFLSIAPKTDARIQGISFFYIAPGNVGLLPGMNAAVLVPSDQTITGAEVPPSALVWNQGAAWIYVRTDATHFVRRPVATGLTAPDGNAIVVGLKDGEQVVVQGAQTLLSLEFQSQIPAGDGDKD